MSFSTFGSGSRGKYVLLSISRYSHPNTALEEVKLYLFLLRIRNMIGCF